MKNLHLLDAVLSHVTGLLVLPCFLSLKHNEVAMEFGSQAPVRIMCVKQSLPHTLMPELNPCIFPISYHWAHISLLWKGSQKCSDQHRSLVPSRHPVSDFCAYHRCQWIEGYQQSWSRSSLVPAPPALVRQEVTKLLLQ